MGKIETLGGGGVIRTIYVAGINTRRLAREADTCPYWLLSVTLLRSKTGIKEWILPYLKHRKIIWDPGTFSDNAINYQGYRRFIDRWVKDEHEYLQYDEIGDPESTKWYLHDMRRRGYRPIPVLQPGGPIELLQEPILAIGGLVPMTPADRKNYLDKLFHLSGKKLGRVHLLGMSQAKWFECYPAASGDSTTWIPRGPYNRQKTIPEWLKEYGEVEIPYRLPSNSQLFMEV